MAAHDLSELDIVIADDHRQMRELIATIVRALGVKKVRICQNGEEALNELRLKPADIVITDWGMKPMDGLELVKRLRDDRTSPCPTIDVIMITGFAERHQVEAARDAGVTEFLVKPVTTDSILRRITNVIEHPRPFVRTGDYFGPDRRRRGVEFEGEDRRRESPDYVGNPKRGIVAPTKRGPGDEAA